MKPDWISLTNLWGKGGGSGERTQTALERLSPKGGRATLWRQEERWGMGSASFTPVWNLEWRMVLACRLGAPAASGCSVPLARPDMSSLPWGIREGGEASSVQQTSFLDIWIVSGRVFCDFLFLKNCVHLRFFFPSSSNYVFILETVCVCVCVCVCVLVTWLCQTLLDSIHYTSAGSSDHEISQLRILEWVAILFSKGSCRPRDWTWVSRIAGRFFTIWAVMEPL